jgi:hypothetical protein
MSHIAQVTDLYITDLETLAVAAKSCGLELVKQDHYRWYGTSVGDTPLPLGFRAEDLGKCDYVLKVPGNRYAYEMGVVRRRDGEPGYTLLWDFWQGGYGLQERVGDGAEKLRFNYSLETTRKQCAEMGFQLFEETQADGSLVILAQKG